MSAPRAASIVTRVTDQDSEFLRFVERHDLKPGQTVRVEGRDEAADSVRLRGQGRREFTIGSRAASKVLVQAARAVLLVLLFAGSAASQPAPASAPPPHFGIVDNSFLVEEAFNQEPGVFQNIAGATRRHGRWAASFTQEWPIGSERHQLSCTLSFLDEGLRFGVGDALVNYRHQTWSEGPRRPAFSPRASLVVPTGSTARGRGDGSYGLQVNLPFSKQTGRWYWHWNGGLTWLPRADRPRPAAGHASLVSPFAAASGVFLIRPLLHVLLESVVVSEAASAAEGVRRDALLTNLAWRAGGLEPRSEAGGRRRGGPRDVRQRAHRDGGTALPVLRAAVPDEALTPA